MKIWEKYFLKEISKVFFLFAGGFYFLYILIDYSAHTKNFHQGEIGFSAIAGYYLAQFVNKADILIPSALLIAAVKVLLSLNMRNEIIALAASGVSLKRILRPFWIYALLSTLFLYGNYEWLQLPACSCMMQFEEKFFGEKQSEVPKTKSLLLEDGTVLAYRCFDAAKQEFLDVFWILSSDQIYKMETLDPISPEHRGHHVHAFIRSPLGTLERADFFENKPFPEMHFDRHALFSAVHPVPWQPISQLAKNLTWTWHCQKINLRNAQIATHFYYKLTQPLACLLVIMASSPFCLRFNRKIPAYLIFSFALFGLIAYFTLVNVSVIVGESQLIAPIWAIWLPPIVFFSIFGWRYAKL